MTRRVAPQGTGAKGRDLLAAGVAVVLLAGASTSVASEQHRFGPGLANGVVRAVDPGEQMLLSADQMEYDYDREVVSAVGNVQIYYGGYTLEADRVTYDQKANRVRAEGNVRMTEPSGNIVRAEEIDLADDLREGFVSALRVQTPDRTRFASASAERLSEEVTVFRKGVYTACEPCRDNPAKPPLWQIKAARIIYDQREKMIYYRGAQLEFYGVPIAHLPFFAHPDPTAGRRTGFLQPSASFASNLGVGISTPYYFNLAPNYDLTLTPTYFTRQGLLGEAEWRHRLVNGGYGVRAAGIFQRDPEAFGQTETPGNRDSRSYLRTSGSFEINDWWNWGWDGWLLSDRTFLRNYSLVPLGTTEVVSKLYLTGLSDRNYLDARVLHFQTLSASEDQGQIPTVHPVVDYNKIFDNPIVGGQLSLDANFTSLSREELSLSHDSSGFSDRSLIRGLPGTATRLSVKAEWERALIDGAGQVFTPFAYLRGDAFAYSIDRTGIEEELAKLGAFDPELVGYEDSFALRAMPAAGLEYHWPFLSAHDWGTQVVEPVGQVIARPGEQEIGEVPNEDAQSLVYDDTTLFQRDKFSGFDRAEGGVRANVGVSYTVALDSGQNANLLFGQSYQIAGHNSFDGTEDEQLRLGLHSGLEDDVSDYVGRIYLEPVKNVAMVTRFRLDEEDLTTERLEVGVQFSTKPVAASIIYADLQPQPNLGYDDPRRQVVGTVGLQLHERWRLTGGGRVDVERNEAREATIGLVYEDECFSVGISYVGQYFKDEDSDPEEKVQLRFNFRTLGGGTVSRRIDTGADAVH